MEKHEFTNRRNNEDLDYVDEIMALSNIYNCK